MNPRFHCPALDTVVGATIELPEAAAHHAMRVLRLRSGDAVTLFDGAGREWQGTLVEADRKVEVIIKDAASGIAEPALHITLVQSLPSGDKMDWIVQKAVELGVSAIQPVAAKRSVVKLDGDRARKRITHWQEVAVSACEQCGRNLVPQVMPLVNLDQFFAVPVSAGEQRFLLAPDAKQRLREMSAPAGRITLLIGPEGGFDEAESIGARRTGFAPLQLGPRVLRTETAGLAAIAAIMALWGDV
ncbi:MAG TPA: 16S rRNA (uracil(1498)-N(3))-methyltransferase [Rhodocyclaceae bacterium]|jgi:16S rRNA (uracil1498-N3)-methyltransferase|nr:16S rRNA (uracil(1498)-N(3))-methyltransferase [Rhodocyclaceae bacterium]